LRYSKDAAEPIERRREHVISTAFKAFSEKGIDTVSMTDIASLCHVGVASVYRYFGTKAELVIAVGTKKWREYYEIIEREYAKAGIAEENAARELEFYIDSYILLFEKYRDILKFNMYFDAYIVRENIDASLLCDYYAAVDLFSAKFHTVYEKAKRDNTVRTDVPELEIFSIIMHAMLLTASKYTSRLVYPSSEDFSTVNALNQIKNMLLNYYCT